ncbi:SRPBCC domain-containing protein [Phaeovulum sp.]|uniref:SRPBCC family protein n=1 Tax=Phaeovulum sp. TaxID=2934796 RepID=UPI003566D003
MKFTAREDIEAPIEAVFAAMTDIAALELVAMRRGVQLRRLDALKALGPGMSWEVGFRYRGKTRQMVGKIASLEAPERLVFEASAQGYEVTMSITLLALSRKRTRIEAEMEVRPRSVSARLLLQSARLGRPALQRRYADRIHLMALGLEERAARGIAQPAAGA